MRIRMTFNGRTMTGTLYDNPSARDFVSMLPLDLTIEDFSSNEKIAHLPRKLDEDGSGPFDNEQPGDLCYFVAVGQSRLLLRRATAYPGDLIRLGRIDGGYEPLLVRGEFPLRIERA